MILIYSIEQFNKAVANNEYIQYYSITTKQWHTIFNGWDSSWANNNQKITRRYIRLKFLRLYKPTKNF